MKLSLYRIRRDLVVCLTITLGLCGLVSTASAGEVQLGVRVSALDSSINAFDVQSAGSPQFSKVDTETVMTSAGKSFAYATSSGNAYVGALHADFIATVNDTNVMVGRGSSATGGGALTGNIIISGSAPPGPATFSALFEGSYTFSNSIFSYQNSASVSYEAIFGDIVKNGVLDFDPRTGGGLFAVPLTFTFNVKPGDNVFVELYMHASVTGLVGTSEVNAMNTFKLTSIDLPPGLSFISDADGFLSQFGASAPPPPPPVDTNPSAVPEPSTTAAVGAAVLGVIALLRHRRRSGKIAGNVEEL